MKDINILVNNMVVLVYIVKILVFILIENYLVILLEKECKFFLRDDIN